MVLNTSGAACSKVIVIAQLAAVMQQTVMRLGKLRWCNAQLFGIDIEPGNLAGIGE
jgi:hypothetical protein